MRIILIILSISFSNFCLSQHSYTVKGDFKLKAEDNKIFLRLSDTYHFNPYTIIDSFIVTDDQFSFNGQIPDLHSDAEIYFKTDNAIERFSFVVDAGTNTLSFNNPTSPDETLFSKTVRPASLSNEIYTKIDSIYEYYTDQYGTYVQDLNSGNKIKMLNDTEKRKELHHTILNTLKQYPSSYYSLIRLYRLLYSATFRETPNPLMETYKVLDAAILETPLAKDFYTDCNDMILSKERSRMGKEVPKFQISTFENTLFENSSLQGQPYIIAFSATWCIPCQESKKTLLSLYKKYKKDGLKVIYFNLDDKMKNWEKDIQKINVDWIHVSERTKFENSDIAKMFKVFAIPYYILVNKNGIIAYNSDELEDIEFEELESYILKDIK